LQEVQAANGGRLTLPLLGAVADAMRLPDARVQGVASFYSLLALAPDTANTYRVCDGPVCMLNGAGPRPAGVDPDWPAERCSCLGLCDQAPAALRGEEPCVAVPGYEQPLPGEERVVMARIGRVDPASIDSALAAGAFQALAAALAKPAGDVLAAVEHAGLRGCGGAGFAVGRKWHVVHDGPGTKKYVVCNADESEPGTFKDRVLMQGDPHLLLEGMALAGYGVGASEGIVYIRGEYGWIARLLEDAVRQATERGWLGDNIQGSGFSFRVHVHPGAGAYICGEESALLESLEGRRGEPRIRPPFPAERGYRGQPTLVDNVETLCQVPGIVANSPAWFRARGTTGSPGTKVFTVTGCVSRPGAFEAPLGITLRQVIDHYGGGVRGGARFKAALAGGAAGFFVPEALLDTPLDFDSVMHGVPLGSGAVIVLDESVSVPAFLACLLHFFEEESCGKCTPCREGTREARAACERIAAGRGTPSDLDDLRRLARLLDLTSFCGLGRSAAWPVESALRHFEGEFRRGIVAQ
jgi:NADH:ubiquinone oxidoreductase subunit F (NADH-binding)